MFTTTGRFPVKDFGGRYRNPEIILSSNDFHSISSGSAKLLTFSPPVSLNVHRSSFPVLTSSEYTSCDERAELMLKPICRPSSCHLIPPITPRGSFCNFSSLRVAIFKRCTTLIPSSFVTNTMRFPSGERSKLLTSQLMCDVKYLCFFVARSM